jgi:hypothetical protein
MQPARQRSLHLTWFDVFLDPAGGSIEIGMVCSGEIATWRRGYQTRIRPILEISRQNAVQSNSCWWLGLAGSGISEKNGQAFGLPAALYFRLNCGRDFASSGGRRCVRTPSTDRSSDRATKNGDANTDAHSTRNRLGPSNNQERNIKVR